MSSITSDIGSYEPMNYADEVSDICKPLAAFGVNYFLYVRVYTNSQRFFLTNLPQWSEYFYQQQLHKHDNFCIEHANNGYYLWNALNHDVIFSQISELYNVNAGLSIAGSQQKFTEYWHFGVRDKVSDATHAFVNNLAQFDRFRQYFLNESAGLVFQVKDLYFGLSHGSCHNETSNNTSLCMRNNLPVDKIYINSEQYITSRETLCVKLLVAGLPLKRIASELDISVRTVEKHVESVKHKLMCRSQFDLGYKLGKLNLL